MALAMCSPSSPVLALDSIVPTPAHNKRIVPCFSAGSSVPAMHNGRLLMARSSLKYPAQLQSNDFLPPLSDLAVHLLPKQRISIYATDVDANLARLADDVWGMPPKSFDYFRQVAVSMCGFIYPSSLTADRLAAATSVQSITFLLDDVCFDNAGLAGIAPESYGIDRTMLGDFPKMRKFFANLYAIFRTRELPVRATPIERAYWNASQEISRLCPLDWFHRFADSLEDFLETSIAIAVDKDYSGACSSFQELQSYIDMRLPNAGMEHTCLLIEFTNDAFLPEEVRKHPHVQQLTGICGRHASLINDFFSYHKEMFVECTSSSFNLIRVIMAAQNVSFGTAVQQAVTMIAADTKIFDEIEANLPTWESPGVNICVRRYIHGLKELMSGGFYWHCSSKRYRSPNSPFPELISLEVDY